MNMIAFVTPFGRRVAFSPGSIESVEPHPEDKHRAVIRTRSGKEHVVERSYSYVVGVFRAFGEHNEVPHTPAVAD